MTAEPLNLFKLGNATGGIIKEMPTITALSTYDEFLNNKAT